jgi:hypothetical protein
MYSNISGLHLLGFFVNVVIKLFISVLWASHTCIPYHLLVAV